MSNLGNLAISVTHSDGRVTRWGPDEATPTEIPNDLTFSTQIPGGFKDLSCSLLRRIDVDYPDLGLFDHVRVYGPGNITVWEGRMAQFPRSHGDGFQIVPGAVGHSAALNDNPTFREIYVDRDFASWGQASVQRRLNIISNYTVLDASVTHDDTTGQPGLATTSKGAWTTTSRPAAEAWYSARGIPIGSLYYYWKKNANVDHTDTNWNWAALLSTDDVNTSSDVSGNLRSAGPNGGTVTATTSTKKYALVYLLYDAGPAGTANMDYSLYWTCLAVYGDHGLTKQGTPSATEAQGLYASDVIEDIVLRTAPSLNISEIEATTFVIPHLVFADPTTGEDAIQFVNAYHGWDWGVYDDMGFFFRAADPDRLTWRARLDDGANLNLEGDTAEQIFNGVYVTYQDASGVQKTVGPTGASADATDATLADTNPLNPVNAWGLTRWGLLNVSQITTLAGATQLGQIWLAQHSAPQRRGTLTLKGTVTHPTEGVVPAWRVRAGDYVSVDGAAANVPRKIIETSYTHGTRELVCNLDNTPFMLDALLARFGATLVGVL